MPHVIGVDAVAMTGEVGEVTLRAQTTRARC
jgi:hypothetical protein